MTNNRHDRELLLFTDTDSDETGVIIFAVKRRTDGSAAFSNNNLLHVKHQLFSTHADSFYGVAFHEISAAITGFDGRTMETKGIRIPSPLLHTLSKVELNGQPFVFHDSFLSFIHAVSNIIQQVSPATVYPGKNGNWMLSEKLTGLVGPLSLPALKKIDHHAYSMSEHAHSDIAVLLSDWAQTAVQHVDTLRNSFGSFKMSLKSQTNDMSLKNWLTSLESTSTTFSLSEHLYPVCLKQWNGDTPDPFQLQLAVGEPERADGNWTLQWYVKDWESDLLVSLADISNGEHPFRSNPVPWLNNWIHSRPLSHLKTLAKIDHETVQLSDKNFSFFLTEDVPELKAKGISVLIPEHLTRKAVPQATGIFSVQGTGDRGFHSAPWVKSHVTWKLAVNDMELGEDTFRALVAEKRQFLRLNDQWVMWDSAMAEQILQAIEETETGKGISFYDAFRASAGKDTALPEPLPSGHDDKMSPLHWKLSSETEALLDKTRIDSIHKKLSEYWRTILKHYQQEGALWLLNMYHMQLGCCLADDMGLGKTIQTLAYMDEQIKKNGVQEPFLILAPASLVHHWKHEIKRYTPHIKAYVHSGGQTERIQRLMKEKSSARCIICSYPTAYRDQEYLSDILWAACIYDEAQQLKNSRTKQRQAVKRITGLHKVALSGTPVENHPSEIWSLMDLLNPGYLKDESWFSETFLLETDTKKRDKKLDHLKELIRPFILRRSKQEFMSQWKLPEKAPRDYFVSLTDEQMVLYQAVTDEWKEAAEEQTELVQRALLFKTMTKLKQICNHPGHLLKENQQKLFQRGRSGKWNKALELLEEWLSTGKRGLVFTQYRFMGELIQSYANHAWHLNVPFFHGGLTARQREKMIDDFQKHRSAPIMVISLRAGGFGINLTQATEVLHYDRWWNPAVEMQAADRVHRIGQTEPVTVHTIITKGTIEERIDDLINEKKQLQEAVIDGRPLPIWNLSNEELSSLFSLNPVQE